MEPAHTAANAAADDNFRVPGGRVTLFLFCVKVPETGVCESDCGKHDECRYEEYILGNDLHQRHHQGVARITYIYDPAAEPRRKASVPQEQRRHGTQIFRKHCREHEQQHEHVHPEKRQQRMYESGRRRCGSRQDQLRQSVCIFGGQTGAVENSGEETGKENKNEYCQYLFHMYTSHIMISRWLSKFFHH